MINVVYKDTDMRYIFLRGDNPKELKELETYLNKIPEYQFLPSFSGVPTPVVFLNKFKTKDNNIIYWCHGGLWKTIYDYCSNKGIEITGIDDRYKYHDFPMTLQEFTKYIEGWNLNITPREYQVKAAWLILKYRQSCSQLATRAGKTLIAYIIMRYMLEHGAKKILMIVPSIQLVKQGVEDMKEYKEFFQSETVWAKGELCTTSNLTIGTFQSLVQRADKRSKKYDPKFFKDYDVVVIDECHKAKCKSINTILQQDFMRNVKLRFGFTGTMPQEGSIDSFSCHSLMGPTIQDISTMELVDAGYLARPHITQIRLKYDDNSQLTQDYIRCGEYLNSSYKTVDGKKILLPKEQREYTMQHEKVLPYVLQQVKGLYTPEEYRAYLIDLCKAKGSNLLMLEQMIIHRNTKRLDVMAEIIENRKGNCIVFAHHTEYLKMLQKYFVQRFPDKKVYVIEGSTNLKKRQTIVDAMSEDNNTILCASYGCCSTGITFKNIDYGIFAQSFKSEIIVLQSLGRGLLKTDDKDIFYLYDIIDYLPTKRIYTQGLAKIRTYKDKRFDYTIVNK